MAEPDLELDSRRALYQHIADNPGVHFRALTAEFEYAKGTIQYQLRWLADEGLINESSDGKYTRYYPTADFDEADRTVMNALRREYSRRVLAHLLAEGPLSTTELGERLDKAKSTVSWHLSNLSEAELVTKERKGRRVVYDVADPDRVERLYAVHQRSFTDRVVDRLLGLWDSY
ncbi:winged helix-turn-helix transcriptional regulator [Halovenus salina]|uniref:Winged helix-turn-helix transcriptional regulator n=1 Tax=Halovenus salina TaxID=1510225 RepID=A0ABD5W1X9_9EURY|nr:metalloregulator ArsR/SmtB family transcription factor [Halovenus salina]